MTQRRLPRRIEDDPRCDQIRAMLEADARLVWTGGSVPVPHLSLTPALTQALREAKGRKLMVQGFETAERALTDEAAGLQALAERTGQVQGERVSRLLVIANDGAERFYRHVDSLLSRQGARLMAIRLDVDGKALGAAVLGAGRNARALLVTDREAVAGVLLALAG